MYLKCVLLAECCNWSLILKLLVMHFCAKPAFLSQSSNRFYKQRSDSQSICFATSLNCYGTQKQTKTKTQQKKTKLNPKNNKQSQNKQTNKTPKWVWAGFSDLNMSKDTPKQTWKMFKWHICKSCLHI